MNGIAAVLIIFYTIGIIALQYIKFSSDRSKFFIRKSVHLLTGLVILLITYHMDKQFVLILIASGTIFSIITYQLGKFNFIHTTSASSMGTLFYPLGLLISIVLLYNMPIHFFRITLMLLTISDTLANLSGIIKNRNLRFTILKDEKSVFGVAAFAVSGFIIHLILWPDVQSGFYYYFMLSVIAAVNFEIISFRGSDNFTIPAGSSIFFVLTDGMTSIPLLTALLIILIASGSVILYKKNILTRYGSIAAYALGIYFFAVLGLKWSVPVVLFFLTSVLFTKINGCINKKPETSSRRNIWQVFANIFFAFISSFLYLITEDVIFIYFYITLIATVTADTWASELGPVFSKRCFSLSDFSFRNSGISGGVSIFGTIASLTGSFLITALLCYLFFNKIDVALISVIAIAGYAGSFIDSVLSAFLEPVLDNMDYFKIRDSLDSLSPNDLINLTASFTAPVFFILFFMMCR